MSISAQDVKTLREQTGAGMMDCKKALQETDGNFDEAIEFLKKQGLAKAEKKAGRIAAEGVVFCKSTDSSAVLVEVNCETDFVAKNEDFQNFGNQVAELFFEKRPTTLDKALQLELNGTSVEETVNALIAKIGEKLTLRRFQFVEQKNGGKLGFYNHMAGKIVVAAEITGNVTDENIKDVCMQVAAMNPQYLKASDVPQDVLDKEKAVFLDQMKDSGKPAEILEKIISGKLNKFANENALLGQVFVKDPSGKQSVGDFIKSLDKDSDVIQFIRYAVGEGIEKRQDDFADEVAKMVQ